MIRSEPMVLLYLSVELQVIISQQEFMEEISSAEEEEEKVGGFLHFRQYWDMYKIREIVQTFVKGPKASIIRWIPCQRYMKTKRYY